MSTSINGKSSGRMSYGKDENGKEILLKDGSLQVMMEWEKPYMEACIDALEPKGDVLEIGFGLGYSATHIQTFHPKSHTIIECEPVVIEKAKEWAKQYKNVHIVEGMWQDELPKLGSFDEIFFDDYSPLSKDEIDAVKKVITKKQELADQWLEKAEAIEKQLEGFKGKKFSDQDIEDFRTYLDLKDSFSYEEVVLFVDGLEEQENITSKQKNSFIQKYKEKHSLLGEKATGVEEESEAASFPLMGDRLFHFFEHCLDHHMHEGSKMSSYIDYVEFKKKELYFKFQIVNREDVDYSEKLIEVDVSSNCTYYEGQKAIVMVITKKKRCLRDKE